MRNRWMIFACLLCAFVAGLAQAQTGGGGGGGASSLTVTDGTNTVGGTSTLTTGNCFRVGGSGGAATVGLSAPNVTKTANYTIAAADMCGVVNFNGASLTVTIPAISSTVLGSGMTVLITNRNASALTVSSTPTINGCPNTTSIPQNGFMALTSNGTTLDAVCGGVTATTLASGTSVSLIGPRAYYVCTSTCTVTPPVPVAGYEFCVMNDDNVATVITLAALGSSARYEATARTSYGTAGTGTLVSGGAAKDEVCIVGLDSTHYLTVSSTGTWTAS